MVSGLARGIDTAAHRGALDGGGRTLAVLGSGLDRPYPPENEGLAAAIAESGAVVSEFPLGTAPYPANFPRRNRIIAGLSRAVVVVEAAERSGALVTARAALEEGRDVFAVPGHPSQPASAGCNQLIRDGALLVRGGRGRGRGDRAPPPGCARRRLRATMSSGPCGTTSRRASRSWAGRAALKRRRSSSV